MYWVILADRRDGAELCYRGISSSPVFLLVLSAGFLKRRSLYFVTKLSDHLPLTNKACRVWQLFLPMEKILGPITVETPQFLGFVVLQHCLGGGQCGGLCSAIIRNCVCMVLLNLVISTSPLIFCQFLTGLSGNAFLVMLFRGVLLCVSCQCCSCLPKHQCWPPASTALPFLPTCLLVNTHCRVQTLFVCACKGSSTCANPRVTREHRDREESVSISQTL